MADATLRLAGTRRRIAAIAFLAATVWAWCLLTASRYQQHPPTAEEAAIGLHLAKGEGFRSPMDPSATAAPSAWSPPIYPAIIGAAYRVFGMGTTAVSALAAVNALAFGLIAAALAVLEFRIFGSTAAAVTTVLLLAVHPLFLAYVVDFWDGLLALALFLWLVNFVVATTDVRSRTSWRAVSLGFLMGVLALTNVSYAPTFPVLAYAASPTHRRWQTLALCLAGLLVVVTPWTIRNAEVFDRFVWVRTGAGVQVWLGNAPVSDGWLDARAYALHPYANSAERARLLEVGEPQYDAEAFQRFLKGFERAPWRFVTNSLRRCAYLVAGDFDGVRPEGSVAWISRVATGWSVLLFSGAIGGMIVAYRHGLRQHLLPLVLLSLAAPFVPTAVIDRYRLPLEAIMTLYAAAFCWLVASGSRLRATKPLGVSP